MVMREAGPPPARPAGPLAPSPARPATPGAIQPGAWIARAVPRVSMPEVPAPTIAFPVVLAAIPKRARCPVPFAPPELRRIFPGLEPPPAHSVRPVIMTMTLTHPLPARPAPPAGLPTRSRMRVPPPVRPALPERLIQTLTRRRPAQRALLTSTPTISPLRPPVPRAPQASSPSIAAPLPAVLIFAALTSTDPTIPVWPVLQEGKTTPVMTPPVPIPSAMLLYAAQTSTYPVTHA